MSVDIVKSILASARPMIQSHGGDIEFVDYQDDIVTVRLSGACVGCPLSVVTLRLGIESQLREKIPTLKKIIALEN